MSGRESFPDGVTLALHMVRCKLERGRSLDVSDIDQLEAFLLSPREVTAEDMEWALRVANEVAAEPFPPEPPQ